MISLRLLSAACALPLTVAAQSLSLSSEVTAAWDDNLSRSMHAEDRSAAAVVSASGNLDDRFPLTRDLALLAGGDAGVTASPRFGGLDSIAGGGHLELRRKFGLGALAPVVSLRTGLGAAAFEESARNEWSADVTLGVAKRFNDVWRLALDADWSRHEARHAAFDREDRGASLAVTWDVSACCSIAAGAGRQWGGQTGNASLKTWNFDTSSDARPDLAAYYNSLPDDNSNTFGPGWVVYHFEGRATRWWCSLATELTPDTSLPLRFETVEVRGGAGTHYASHLLSLSLVHRF